MANAYLDIATTPAVKAAQVANGSRALYARGEGGPVGNDRLGAREAQFVSARDSFYMATVSETGWPYLQHRGGPAGFLRVLDERTLGIADYAGNRQYLTLGNLTGNDRAALFLMDYPAHRRLKLFARVEPRALADDASLAEALATPGYRGVAERALLFHVEAFDWNCPQHITARWTEAQVVATVQPLRDRLAALQAEHAALRAAVEGNSA